jgi:hypothetical protein
MGALLEQLVKLGEATNVSHQSIPAAAAREIFSKTVATRDGYGGTVPAPKETNALGSASGDVSAQDEEPGVDEINLDATLFDQKVRELVQGAGGKYNYRAAKAAGMVKRADPLLLEAAERLEKNAALLNRAIALTNERLARKRTMQTQPGSSSSSTSVSASGSISGSTSGEVSKAITGDVAARLRLMGR